VEVLRSAWLESDSLTGVSATLQDQHCAVQHNGNMTVFTFVTSDIWQLNQMASIQGPSSSSILAFPVATGFRQPRLLTPLPVMASKIIGFTECHITCFGARDNSLQQRMLDPFPRRGR